MSAHQYQIKVENLPPDIRETKLKLFFQNRRRQGGGPVKEIQLYQDSCTAIITFEEISAVQIVLGRGDTVTIEDTPCKVSPVEAPHCGQDGAPAASCRKQSTASSSVGQKGQKCFEQTKQPFFDSKPKKEKRLGSSRFVDRTVQIHVNDPKIHLDNITYYLEDDSVNTGKFFDDHIYLDGLAMKVFVPFERYEDAELLCTDDTGEEKIVKIEMADKEEFDHYNNMFSVHGKDFSSSKEKENLKRYVQDKSGLSPVQIVLGEEPCSAIVVMDQRASGTLSSLYSIAWKCAGKDGEAHLTTAPVRQCSTILATCASNSDITEKDIQRYFKRKIAGGKTNNVSPILSTKRMEPKVSFIVEFKDVQDAQSIVDVENHTFSGTDIKVRLWHRCLTKEAYEDYLNLCEQLNVAQSPQAQSSNAARWKKFAGPSEVMKFSRPKYILLQRKGVSSVVQGEYGIVESDDVSHSYTIKGTEKFVKTTKSKIKEQETHIDEECLSKFDGKKLIFLRDPDVLECINSVLEEKGQMAYVFDDNGKMKCLTDQGVKIKAVTDLIEKHLLADKKSFGDKIKGLIGDKGNDFLSGLHRNLGVPCQISVDERKSEVSVFAFQKVSSKLCNLHSLFNEIESFINNNLSDDCVQFSDLKLEFVRAFCDAKIEKLKSSEVSVKVEKDRITVSGTQMPVQEASKKIKTIRDKITEQDCVIQKFGITEFLSSDSGQDILNTIGNKNKCLLKLSSGPSADGKDKQSAPGRMCKLIASCTVDKINVKFMLGDITSLNVNVIINSIDYTRQCQKGMSKFIVENGGKDIQKELDAYSDDTSTGTFVVTQGGKLNCSAIYHLILEKGLEAGQLLPFIVSCLKRAELDGHKSVAMPVLGCGRFRIDKVGASLNIAKAVKRQAGLADEGSSLTEVIVCDQDVGRLKSSMKRFENVQHLMALDEGENESEDDGHDDSPHSKDKAASGGRSDTGKFGTLTLSMKGGDIAQEKCDAIVCGVKEDLDLQTGGAVSKILFKMCGEPLQNECSQKGEEFQGGVVATSSHGLSCKAIIFVSITKFSRRWDEGVRKVLVLAENKGYTSIALPAFGTGTKHADVDKLKSLILGSIQTFGNEAKPQNLKDVRLVIFDKKILSMFRGGDVGNSRRNKKDHARSPVPIISSSARVHVVFEKAEAGDKAIKDLKSKCDGFFKKQSVKNFNPEKLSKQQMDELVAIGLRKQVKLSIQNNTVVLESFDTLGMMDVQGELIKYYGDMKDKEHRNIVASVKTAFKWQFMSKNRWRDFEPEVNIKIERAFQDSKDSATITDPTGRNYRLDFKTMKEYRVRKDGEEELTTINRFDIEAAGGKLPNSWAKMDPGENLKMVPLSNSSKEYQDVEKYFKSCGAKSTVKSIDRIQNVVLHQQYQSKKTYFEITNPKGTENEKKLFHGTDAAAIANINESGFNRSFCGKNATAYGNGVYFALQSAYSEGYARADAQGNRMMYLAKVLVGESTPSKSGMNHLPNKPGTNRPFDSGQGPSMYIIFHDCQAYPEYLITF